VDHVEQARLGGLHLTTIGRRAACYHLVPGVVRFYDTNSLPRLVEDQGLTVVECNGEPGRVSVLARVTSLVECALQRRGP